MENLFLILSHHYAVTT